MFLDGLADKSTTIQASCLVNVGQIVKLLHYAIQPYVEYIIKALFTVLNNSTIHHEVHRGMIPNILRFSISYV